MAKSSNLEAEKDRLRNEVESAYIAFGINLIDEGPDLEAYVDGHVDSLAMMITKMRVEKNGLQKLIKEWIDGPLTMMIHIGKKAIT